MFLNLKGKELSGCNLFKVEPGFCDATQGSPDRPGQPWAEGRNPFGIVARQRQVEFCWVTSHSRGDPFCCSADGISLHKFVLCLGGPIFGGVAQSFEQ